MCRAVIDRSKNHGLDGPGLLKITKKSRSFIGPGIRGAGEVKNYNVADGVPEGSILSIVEDRSGNVWVGGPYGLVEFDGGKWRRIGTERGYLAGGAQSMFGG